MGKRGSAFYSIVEDRLLRPAVWDPDYYRADERTRLGDYVEVTALRRPAQVSSGGFRALEYADIGNGDHLTFRLEQSTSPPAPRLWAAGEQELLMGTMRAYLGNIIVTPRREWLGRTEELEFVVKAEFVRIEPNDGLVYFWWALLRSPEFLGGLPAGGGGTRPRLHPQVLAAMPVAVPGLDTRAELHRALEDCAAREWRDSLRRRSLLDSLWLS